jgi:uncharacterized protein (DUF488 family)
LNPVFTVGHSNHSIERFIELLKQNGVTAIGDVRSVPFSRRNPQFNKEPLARALKAEGIAYVHLGRELGARSDDPACYEHGQVRYQRLAQTEIFRAGLERVLQGRSNYQLALMCAEKEPLDCHRTLLVARALEKRGVDLEHILASGEREAHVTTMRRLVEMMHLDSDDLFVDAARQVDEACALREAKIAYVRN